VESSASMHRSDASRRDIDTVAYRTSEVRNALARDVCWGKRHYYRTLGNIVAVLLGQSLVVSFPRNSTGKHPANFVGTVAAAHHPWAQRDAVTCLAKMPAWLMRRKTFLSEIAKDLRKVKPGVELQVRGCKIPRRSRSDHTRTAVTMRRLLLQAAISQQANLVQKA
jgi:hypothetical protein